MKIQNRFFYRIWDGEKYWYPILSVSGINYESSDLPSEEENLRNLTWALDWHIKNDIIEFNHIVEGCVGKKDINEKLIYEGDIVKVWHINQYLYGIVQWSITFNGYFIMTPFAGYKHIENCQDVEIVGDIHHDLDIYSDLKLMMEN